MQARGPSRSSRAGHVTPLRSRRRSGRTASRRCRRRPVGRRGRRRRPHPWRRRAPDRVLGPRRGAKARGEGRAPPRAARHLRRRHARTPVPRRDVSLSGRARRRPCDRAPVRPRAGLPRAPDPARRELRRCDRRSAGRGSRVEPRVVRGDDENRLTGYAALPSTRTPTSRTSVPPFPSPARSAPRRGRTTSSSTARRPQGQAASTSASGSTTSRRRAPRPSGAPSVAASRSGSGSPTEDRASTSARSTRRSTASQRGRSWSGAR